MDRRKFLRNLAVAPIAAKFLTSDLGEPTPRTDPWSNYTEGPYQAVVGEWNNYANFSSFAIASSLDEMVHQSARELSYRSGLAIQALQASTKNSSFKFFNKDR